MANCCKDIAHGRYTHDGLGTAAILKEKTNTTSAGKTVEIAVETAIIEKNAEDICRLIKTCEEVKKGLSGGEKTTVGRWIKDLKKACKGGSGGGGGPRTPTVIKGCTDQDYEEYNPNATEHRQSDCETLKVVKIYGCTDVNAYNYKSNATDDDGTCEFAEQIYLKYSYSFCNIKAGCDLVESSTKLVFEGGKDHDYVNETQLSDTDDNVLFFEEKIVDELAENIELSGGFFPWGNEGWYTTPIAADLKTDLAKALTLAIMLTFEFEFFPFTKVAVYEEDTPIGEFIIKKGTNRSIPSKRIQALTPSNSKNTVIARSIHNTQLKKNVNINGLNKALTDRGITQFKVIQDGNNQVLVNVDITEPESSKVVDNTKKVVDDTKINVNLEVESVVGLGNLIKEEPIGLAKLLE